MTQLGASELNAVLAFAREAGATADLESFRHELVPRLRQLIPCDTLGHTEIDLERGTGFSISDAPAADDVGTRLLELAHQHPLVPYQQRGDGRARLISDFLSLRAFHRLELYEDIYRPLGVEDQLAFGLGGDSIVAIHLTRRRRTFTERDRSMVELLRPYLALTYRNALDHERTRAVIDALEDGLEEHRVGVLQLDARGRIVHANATALERLEEYFDEAAHIGADLPERIRRWMELPHSLGDGAHNGSASPLIVERERGCLHVRAQAAEPGAEWRTLILQERSPSLPSIESLRALGLTSRQASVLRLLAAGKTAAQIAAELQIAGATVEKHIEHIRERLGVSTRAEAVACVYGASS